MRWKRLLPVLLEAVFIVAAWLVAWLVFDARLYVIIIVIFAAYALVFLYDVAIGLDRREQAEFRRSKREESKREESHYGLAESIPDAFPSAQATDEAKKAEPRSSIEPAVSPWRVEQPAVEPREGAVTSESDLPREVIAAQERSAREQAEREAREREAALKPPELEPEPKREPEPEPKREPEPEPVPGSVAEVVSVAAQPAPEAQAEPERPPEHESLLAEFAAHPGEGRRTHAIGGWNIWQLERMMAARTTREEERDNERSLLLIYLREFADSDGQLPPEFDALVNESFGDLVRGPAGP